MQSHDSAVEKVQKGKVVLITTLRLKHMILKKYSTLKTTDPTPLQQKVVIDIVLYFGRRGRENLRNLKVDDFQVGIKQGGGDVELRFVYI